MERDAGNGLAPDVGSLGTGVWRAAALLACLALGACGPSRRPLGNGYSLVDTGGAAGIAAADGSVKVPALIVSVGVSGSWVAGVIRRPKDRGAWIPDRHVGYFVLDTATGELLLGMTKGAMDDYFRMKNIKAPKLRQVP